MGRTTLQLFTTDAERSPYGIEQILLEFKGDQSSPSAVHLRPATDKDDDEDFQAVLWQEQHGGHGDFRGEVTLPALSINKVELKFVHRVLTFDGQTYSSSTKIPMANKPIVEIIKLIRIDYGGDGHPDGYLVILQNRPTGRTHTYLQGSPVKVLAGGFQRRPGQISGDGHPDNEGVEARETYQTEDGNVYVYEVRGSHDDPDGHTTTFDGHPAEQLDPEDYVIVVEDLDSVTVTPKSNQ